MFDEQQNRDVAPAGSMNMVAFDAYRNKPLHVEQKYVTFDGTEVNVGGAFNAETGMVSQSMP